MVVAMHEGGVRVRRGGRHVAGTHRWRGLEPPRGSPPLSNARDRRWVLQVGCDIDGVRGMRGHDGGHKMGIAVTEIGG